jgi:hypothetical protein
VTEQLIGIEAGFDRAPPTPPGMRIPTRRFISPEQTASRDLQGLSILGRAATSWTCPSEAGGQVGTPSEQRDVRNIPCSTGTPVVGDIHPATADGIISAAGYRQISGTLFDRRTYFRPATGEVRRRPSHVLSTLRDNTRWQHGGSDEVEDVELPALEVVRRWCLHILPKGFTKRRV